MTDFDTDTDYNDEQITQTKSGGSAIKWVVGCCGCGCGGAIFLTIAIIGLTIVGLSETMISSEPFQYAISLANQSEAVSEKIGSPIEEGWIAVGYIKVGNSNGSLSADIPNTDDDGIADITIPISGSSETKGSLRVVGTKNNGVWNYSIITVTIEDTGEVIDLLPSNTQSGQ